MNSAVKQSLVSLGGVFLAIASFQVVIVLNQSIRLNDKQLKCIEIQEYELRKSTNRSFTQELITERCR